MIPSTIEREHVIEAMRKINSEGVPAGRGSKKFLLEFEGKRYPPKYVTSLANKFANDEELDSSSFNGGQETNGFLRRLGFDIVEGPLHHDSIVSPLNGPLGKAVQTEQHVTKFKNIIESRRKDLNGWVATVTLRSDNDTDYSNGERMRALSEIVGSIAKETSGDGVILFPGGWFCTDKEKPSTIYDWIEKQVGGILEATEAHVIACIGIDGSAKASCGKTQVGLAVDKAGIKAIGRKFHPAPQERGYVNLADDYLSEEDEKSRIFELNGVKYFMCVCYDIYGIRHGNLPNPGVDVVLNLVHCFYPVGKGPSGTSFFAKWGFAGASKQWSCPVFGTAVFFSCNIPENWPTGVHWNQGSKNTKKWRYADNPIRSGGDFCLKIKKDRPNVNEDIALVKIYDLATI